MKLLTVRDAIRRVADDWYNLYGSSIDSAEQDVGNVYHVGVCAYVEPYHKLRELDVETATAEDVQRIIGDTAWIPGCNECGKKSCDVVRVGEEPDYESETAYICLDCAKEALQLLGGALS